MGGRSLTWRTVILTKEAKLSLRMQHLVITNEEVVRIPLVELGLLIIENPNIIVTMHLLNALVDNKTTVIICDQAHNPSIFVQAIYGHHRQSKNITQQFNWLDEVKGLLWKQIVEYKIHFQKLLLEHIQRDGVEELHNYEFEVLPHDSTNREGLAAKVYFNRLFGEGFYRGDETPINWGLNYGYSILHSQIARTIVSRGFLTEIGIHHKNEFNQYNLASDFIEIFRPIVDFVVFENVTGSFTVTERRKIIDILKKKIFIKNGEFHLMQAVPIFVDSCLQFLSSNGKTKLAFPNWDYKNL